MHHFFRFSLRDLFWLTLVVAMGLGWWVTAHLNQTDKFSRRAGALEQALQRIGWQVEYDHFETEHEPHDTEFVTVTRASNGNDQLRFYYGLPIGHSGVVNTDALSQPANPSN